MIGEVPMRKFEQQIHDRALIAAMLDRIPIVHLGCSDGGWPYVVPLSFGYEVTEEALRVYLHSAREGRKVDLWERDPRVSLTFSVFQNRPDHPYLGEIHDYRSVMANGLIRRIPRRGRDSLHGRGFQAILRHNGRRPAQFDVTHYGFMDLYLVECPWERVTAKAEIPFTTPAEAALPPWEEIVTGGAGEWDSAFFFNRKVYGTTAAGGGPVSLSPLPPLEETLLPAAPVKLTFRWAPPAADFDCDVIALVLDGKGRLQRRYDLAFYNQKTDRSGSVTHLGDDRLGRAGEEALSVDLSALPEPWGQVAFFLSAHEGESRGHHLGMLSAVRLTVEDTDGAVIARGSLSGDWAGKGSALAARLTRSPGGWRLTGPDGSAWADWRATALFAAHGLERWRE